MEQVFKALADKTRRELLDALRRHDGQTLSELCTELDMTRQAVSKHIAILESANLIAVRKVGRYRQHYLNPLPLREIADRWIEPFRDHKLDALLNLKRDLEASEIQTQSSPHSGDSS